MLWKLLSPPSRKVVSAALLASIVVLTGAACVPKPKQDYTSDQLKQIESLDELMRVQAQTADPQFNRIGQAAYTAEDYTSMADAARRLQAAAEVLRTRHSQNRPPSFATYASRLGEQASELLAATESKDVAKASSALTGIRDTCRTCHKEHR
jgi:cytochrome c556